MKNIAYGLLLILSLFPFDATAQERHTSGRSEHQGEHSFGVREFDAFHDILHPLQHDALPNNNFRIIRSRANDLHMAGQAIVSLSAPRGVRSASAYRREARNFRNALARFKRDAERGTDAQLRVSYTAVHDTFERLAGLLITRAH